MWKRRKDLLYIGSVHGGELPEMYGLIGDKVGTDALGMYFLTFPSVISVIDEDRTSKLHQSSKPQPPERFQCYQPIVKYRLAEIHP